MPYIQLTKGYSTLVDAEDLAFLGDYKWHAHVGRDERYVYASCSAGRMHTLLMRPPAGMQVDHVNHKTLDNRRANLRICTPTENRRNAKHRRDAGSQYKGATWNNGWWFTQITVNKQNIYLGRYKSELDAALAYDSAALKYFGEFANVNFKRSALKEAV